METKTRQLAIDARHLVKRYKTTVAVNDVSLQIPAGQVFGVLGANGAGKTTLVEMIAGVRSPTQGSVQILGLDPFTQRNSVSQILGV
ncbi:MAG: ATP-binding cassette domain-containing protein, partial [Ancrocorticia populi]